MAASNHKLQRKFSFIQNKVVGNKLWHFFSWKLKLPLQINLELSHVALFLVLLLSHVLPCFPTLKLSSLYLVIFRHPYLIHMKSNSRNFLCHEFSTSSSSTFSIWISTWRKFSCLQTLRRFNGIISLSMNPLVEFFYF
jgi:hypothetical protein